MTEQLRVLVVEDEPDAAEYVRTVLTRRGGMDVVVVHDPISALAEVDRTVFDAVVTDIQLPGMSGLDLLTELRARRPGLPVVVMTAFASVDYAVEALRRDADEFLTKPVSAATLVDRVGTVARAGRRRRQERHHEVVLAVGAHPDDVEIGIGATLASHHANGDAVVILTLSGGAVGGTVEARREEALASAALVGARLFLHDHPDTRLGTDPGLITTVEQVVREVAPTIVYTHSAHDRHQDHRAVHQAVDVAARRVASVGCFQSPSSTIDYRPTRFVPVDDFVDTKLAMLAAFASQAHRDYMAPDLVRATTRYWSRFSTSEHAEPLEMIRMAALPSTARAAQVGTTADDHDHSAPTGGR